MHPRPTPERRRPANGDAARIVAIAGTPARAMSALPEPAVSASVCPLCQGPNRCAMASADAAATPCWCVAAVFDPSALARASAADGGAACVCAACAAAAP